MEDILRSSSRREARQHPVAVAMLDGNPREDRRPEGKADGVGVSVGHLQEVDSFPLGQDLDLWFDIRHSLNQGEPARRNTHD
jgi:hypothetical protein